MAYGDNAYRITNPHDAENCSIILDHLNGEERAYGLLVNDKAQWLALLKEFGTVKHLYYNEEHGFAIVRMATHDEAFNVFKRVGNIAWDTEFDVDYQSVHVIYHKHTFARWWRPKEAHYPKLHRKPGSTPCEMKVKSRH